MPSGQISPNKKISTIVSHYIFFLKISTLVEKDFESVKSIGNHAFSDFARQFV